VLDWTLCIIIYIYIYIYICLNIYTSGWTLSKFFIWQTDLPDTESLDLSCFNFIALFFSKATVETRLQRIVAGSQSWCWLVAWEVLYVGCRVTTARRRWIQHQIVQSGPRKSSPPSVLHCKSLCYIGYTSTWLEVRRCVLMQEATTFNIFYDGISFQHLACRSVFHLYLFFTAILIQGI
jgi:hypothetical protein